MTQILQTTPMRVAETNTRPRFAVPAGACDAHFHVFEPGFPHVPDPLYTFPDATLGQYLRLTEVLGIERMVLVQPTFYGTDNALLVQTLRKAGPRCRGVVRIADDAGDDELDRYHRAGVRAIRLDLFARASWPTGDIIAYIRAMAARARPRGWHLQFYTPGTVVRDLLPFLGDFQDTFVIDHMGYMKESDGLTVADFDRLVAVLAGGHCYLKLSGPYRVAPGRPLSAVQPIGRALVGARPDRLIWGSDWPHLPDGQRDTGELLNLLADWAPGDADRHQILVESPARLFYADLPGLLAGRRTLTRPVEMPASDGPDRCMAGELAKLYILIAPAMKLAQYGTPVFRADVLCLPRRRSCCGAGGGVARAG
jgi:2-pyrone-4,6-dicarboxylate lactonase